MQKANYILLICAFALMCFIVCSDQKDNKKNNPIFVLGLDGFEWDFVLPLLKKNQLPNLTNLMRCGYYGELKTSKPSFSPIVWTSIATGKVRKKHGIQNFFRRTNKPKEKKENIELTLIKSSDRKTKAIWNILTDYNKKVWSIGWWITFPAEKINGIIVSQINTLPDLSTDRGLNEKIFKGTLLKGIEGQVHPSERQNEIIDLLSEVNEQLPKLIRDIFGEFSISLSPLDKRMWDNCTWAFRADYTYYRITEKLTQEESLPDLTLLYFGGPDVVGHRFLRYKYPELYQHKPTSDQISDLGKIIDNYYIYCDQILGNIMKIYGQDTTFFIISDHGMVPINLDAEFDPNDPWSANSSGGHRNSPPAFFCAAGPLIRKIPSLKSPQNLSREDLVTVCSIYDITPTILAILQIPIGKDMDGDAVTKIFRDDFRSKLQITKVATHDTDEFLRNQEKRKKGYSFSPNEKKRLEQLKSLGYIK